MTRRFSEGDRVRTFEGDTGVVTRIFREAPHIYYDYLVRLSSGEELCYWDDELRISLVKDLAKIAEAIFRKTRDEAGLLMRPRVELNFAVTPADHDSECEGHESLRGDAMGAAVYCDGSCRPAWTPLIRV
jgi:hypothetical protein